MLRRPAWPGLSSAFGGIGASRRDSQAPRTKSESAPEMGRFFRSGLGDSKLCSEHFGDAKHAMSMRQDLAVPIAVVGTGNPDVGTIGFCPPRDTCPDDVAVAHIGAEVLLTCLAPNLTHLPANGGVEERTAHEVRHIVTQLVAVQAEVAFFGVMWKPRPLPF